LFSILIVRNNQCSSSDFRPIDHLIKSNHDPLEIYYNPPVIFGDPSDGLIMLNLHKCGKYIVANVVFQHPVALYRSDFWSFHAICVQRRSLFFLRIPILDTTCFGLTGRLQVYRLLWLRILLLTVMFSFLLL
jgi:hypothetical protein